MDGSKYFWSSPFDVKFDAESESEVECVLWAWETKPLSDFRMKISQYVRLYEHLWITQVDQNGVV
jgi:hypothetical protein